LVADADRGFAITECLMAKHRDKNTYPTYKDALRVLLKSSQRRGTALRIYLCTECNGYHLTRERRG
jgi:hypothetical protein